MKNIPLPIEENELDALLRQLVLDGGSDEFTQHTLTMNADFIFNSAPEITPAASRETALIQKLEEAFIKRRGPRSFWLNGIIFLCLVAAGVWIWKINSGSATAPSPQNGNNTNAFSPAGPGDTGFAENKVAMQEASFTTTQLPSANDSVETDTAFSQEKKEHYVTPDSRIPIERNWYEGKEAATTVDLPGPVFSAKASPENYKRKQGNFEMSGNNMFGCDQDSFSAAYYTGEPFKSGMNDMQYFNLGDYAQREQAERADKNRNTGTTCDRWAMPWAVLGYADPNEVEVRTKPSLVGKDTMHFTGMFLHKLPEKGIQLAMSPFYFRKYEVTNKEYREFINWVRAANGFADKVIGTVQVDTIEVTNPNDKEGVLVTPAGKRYRLAKRSIPVEDYKEVYNYTFFNKNSAAAKAFGKNSIYVLPDTSCWITDFAFAYNEPMSNFYFWHPAYDNYPVVGVSWYQAMAFLDWKTHMHQQQLDKENIPYEIEYTLPSDIEWELASISESVGKNICFLPYYECSEDWMTTLGVSVPNADLQGRNDPYQRPNYLKNLFTKDQYWRGNYIQDGYFHTGPADLSHAKLPADSKTHLDALGISWMDGNVSEWMAESYAENWKPFFQKHLLVLDTDKSESMALAKQIEMLYDKGNAANGRLVRGANWYDERFSSRPSSLRNEAGIGAKRFIDPSEQHSTVGFRYVVHVRRK